MTINPANADASESTPQIYEQLSLALLDIVDLLAATEPAALALFREKAQRMLDAVPESHWIHKQILLAVSEIR